MRVRVFTCLAALAALVVLAALAGCGGSSSSSGISSESPQKILNDSLAAANGLKSVHAVGAINSSGQQIKIDLHLLNGVGGRGQITLGGLGFNLVGRGSYAYLEASPAVWEKAGAPASAAQQLQGKWLRAPASGQFGSIASLTNIHTLFSQLLSQHGKGLKTGGVSTVAGHKVVAVKSDQGTLYVAATGKPYPIEVVKSGSDGGKIDFDSFDEALTVSAPSNTIDVPSVSG